MAGTNANAARLAKSDDVIGYVLETSGDDLKPGEVAIRIIRDCQVDDFKRFSGEAAQKLIHLQDTTPERDWQMILWSEVHGA